MNSEKNTINQEITARASLKNEPLSTKQSVEICNFLRYKTTSEAKQILQRVAELKQAIPFKHSTMDLGHKRGMGPGSFPQKAAHHFLKLLQAVEANAQFQGLNTSNLKIIKLLANKAAIPLTGRRNRTAEREPT